MTTRSPAARRRQVTKARKAEQGFLDTFRMDVAVMICERIAEGETLAKICRDSGMPDRSTFRKWVLRNEDLRAAYEAARELQSHSLFDETLDLTRRLQDDNELSNVQVTAFRVALDNLRWAAGKLNPQQYGERSNPNAALAIQIITPLNLGQAGKEYGPGPGENLYTLTASLVAPNEPGEAPAQIAASRPSVPDASEARPSNAPQPGDGG